MEGGGRTKRRHRFFSPGAVGEMHSAPREPKRRRRFALPAHSIVRNLGTGNFSSSFPPIFLERLRRDRREFAGFGPAVGGVESRAFDQGMQLLTEAAERRD